MSRDIVACLSSFPFLLVGEPLREHAEEGSYKEKQVWLEPVDSPNNSGGGGVSMACSGRIRGPAWMCFTDCYLHK